MIDNPIPWPHGTRCAVAITWDLDADSGLNYYHPDRADQLVASQSLTRYGPSIAMRVSTCRSSNGWPPTVRRTVVPVAVLPMASERRRRCCRSPRTIGCGYW